MLRAFSPPVPLCRSSRLAVDTTLVSPVTAAGLPRRAGGRPAGAALLIARRAKERTYPELCRSNRCRLTVIALEIGGVVRLLARCRARLCRHPHALPPSRLSLSGGLCSSPVQPHALSQPACCPCPSLARPMLTRLPNPRSPAVWRECALRAPPLPPFAVKMWKCQLYVGGGFQ